MRWIETKFTGPGSRARREWNLAVHRTLALRIVMVDHVYRVFRIVPERSPWHIASTGSLDLARSLALANLSDLERLAFELESE